MNYKEAHRRMIAAQTLLLEPTTSREKFNHIRSLIRGINPTLDNTLERCERELSTVEKMLGLDVVSLTADNLPEHTEEHKRRKKAILFFLTNWNKLKSEVARVEHELAAAQSSQTQGQKTSHWGRIFNFAKGPLGIITIAAVGIALAGQVLAVHVTIKNQGCDTMIPSASMPFPIPGLSLPTDPIKNGGSAVATIPGLTFTIDGTQQGTLTAKAFTFTMSFQLSGGLKDVKLDGVSLLGKKTVARLQDKKEHELTFVCRG